MPKPKSSDKTVKTTAKLKKSAPKKSATSTPTRTKKAAKLPAKSLAPKKTAKRVRVKISNDDIARRAYFIAERRREMGWGGDETSDWVDAERQLKLEAQEAARAKS